jgi:hypothetical protein
MTRPRPRDGDPGPVPEPVPAPPGPADPPGPPVPADPPADPPGPPQPHDPPDPRPDPNPDPAARERHRQRAEAVRDAAAELAPGEVYAHRTAGGQEVHIQRFELHDNGETCWVEVFAVGEVEGGDPHFRIYNPPMLTRDPLGDIERNGVMFRLDPLAAVADVLASMGGAQRQKGRAR